MATISIPPFSMSALCCSIIKQNSGNLLYDISKITFYILKCSNKANITKNLEIRKLLIYKMEKTVFRAEDYS